MQTLAANETKPNELVPRPVQFVVYASPKSGTTWVQRLLSAHPDIYCGESRPFGRYFNPANPSAPYVTLDAFAEILSEYHLAALPPGVDRTAFTAALSDDLWRQVARTTIAQTGKRLYGEKITPPRGRAAAVLERLSAIDSDLALIHLVRDPRDVVVSGFVQQVGLRQESPSVDEPEEWSAGTDLRRIPDDRFEFMLELWRSTVEAAVEVGARFPNRLTVRYEDLLDRPRDEFKRILERIGASSTPETVAQCVDKASFERLSGGRERGVEDASSFFRKGVAGDWRNWLTRDQAKRAVEVAGVWLQKFGYDLDAAPYKP
ncbi:MAG: sulfotransferase domain-containing protein [Phycisphaerales bacterium]